MTRSEVNANRYATVVSGVCRGAIKPSRTLMGYEHIPCGQTLSSLISRVFSGPQLTDEQKWKPTFFRYID